MDIQFFTIGWSLFSPVAARLISSSSHSSSTHKWAGTLSLLLLSSPAATLKSHLVKTLTKTSR